MRKNFIGNNKEIKEEKIIEIVHSRKFIDEVLSIYKNSQNKKRIDFFSIMNRFIQEEKTETKKTIKKSNYFIKINANVNSISDKNFIIITQSFRSIVENFCELFKIDTQNLEISIISATTGCFNINFGINLNIKEFSFIKFPQIELDLVKYIIKYLTDNEIEFYENKPLQLLKDCTTAYLANKIPKNNEKLKYLDIKKSKEAKKTIYKTIKSLPGAESVSFNGALVMSSEMDVMV